MNKIREKNKSIIKVTIVLLITISIMIFTSNIIYSSIADEKVSINVDVGLKFFKDRKYEEAIIEFRKAKKINPKSTEIRLNLAKAYIEIDKINNAIGELKEAQKTDRKNETLLIEILEILEDIDQDATYKMLEKYIAVVGQDNISMDL